MNQVIAIVVTYNRKELLQEAIDALKKSHAPCDILVVDNASTDGTSELVATQTGAFGDGRTLYYENTGANLGGAGGFQYGVRRAYELGYEYFWLMDDDTIVNPESLDALLEASAQLNGEFGWLSGLALWTDGAVCRMNYHEASSLWNEDKKLLTQGMLRTQLATFVCFFTRRSVVEEVGLPIAEYFIWGDDTEYSNRIANRYPCYLVSRCQVTHKMKANENSETLVNMKDEGRIRRSFYSIRNDLCTFRRNSVKTGIKTWLNTCKLWWKVLLKAKEHKGLKLHIIWKGTWAGLFFAPAIEYVKR